MNFGRKAADVQKMDAPKEPRNTTTATNVWDSRNRSRLATVCLASLASGFNAASIGALLPHIQSYYQIEYAVVSLIFVGQAIGFLFAAIFFDDLRERLSQARISGLANIILICGYCAIIARAPFAFIPISFGLIGFGTAINLALSNLFDYSLPTGSPVLKLAHVCYGVGGTLSPIAATAITALDGTLFNRFYLINLSLAVIIFLLSAWAFWECDEGLTQTLRNKKKPQEATLNDIFPTLRIRAILLGAIFTFAYQGAEVSISGWLISFLIENSDGVPRSVGYITACFWGGITVGRLSLSGRRWGESSFIFGLTATAFILQISMWIVPNILGNNVAVALVGLVLGPMYPCGSAVFIRNVSRRESLRGMSTFTAFASLGGAIAPFMTGLLAQVAGTFVLHPICLSLYVIMMLCWYFIPAGEKRQD
ncbi:hypothetical protein FALBO_16516 [Fusarium albosuccineum]|uniref:Major facilitator superfamily (MFS) profile domain-containing protein n=1 Tax=Fusarium albosuccineum TaxID=1237068 RepID=A0A8H4NT51_9HYPO|nr:hypothetical protein FALBO_16516 [Fusarium albosuccineum]